MLYLWMLLLVSVELNISKEEARPITPLTTYAIIDRASISTMMFLFDNLYQEKNALASRPSVAIQSP